MVITYLTVKIPMDITTHSLWFICVVTVDFQSVHEIHFGCASHYLYQCDYYSLLARNNTGHEVGKMQYVYDCCVCVLSLYLLVIIMCCPCICW
jgi:hypothetical protein